MNDFISKEDAFVLHKYGIELLTMNTEHKPEYWCRFKPSDIQLKANVFKIKHQTIDVVGVKTAIPIKPEDGDAFYTLTGCWGKWKIVNGEATECEDDVKRNDLIGCFKTAEESAEVVNSLGIFMRKTLGN